MLYRTNFVDTLRALANSEDPVQVFYNSSLTDKMVEEFKRNGMFILVAAGFLFSARLPTSSLGGLLTKEDFVRYRSIVRPDDDVVYTDLSNDRRVCGPPPPSGSAVTQAILKILDGYALRRKHTGFHHQLA